MKEGNPLNNTIDIKETAALLTVSTATIRNWMKAGKLQSAHKQGNTILFYKHEIEAIKEEITSGKSHRLKSRRNKKAAIGHFIPTEYVSSEAYLTFAGQLLNWVSEQNELIEPGPILYEVILNLLIHKKCIIPTDTQSEKSGLELVQENQLNPGVYTTLLKELHDPDTFLNEGTREVLRKISGSHLPYIEGDDVLGLLYMSLSSLSARKNKGSYYTPSDIVDQLIEQSFSSLGEHMTPRAVDPCCGSGNFLIRLFIQLKKRLLSSGMQRKDVEELLLRDCLYGYDIDPMAITLAKANILLLLETPYEELNHIPLQFHCKNTLETQDTLFSENNDLTFDLVIGNPPWGYSFTRQEANVLKERFIVAKGALESFCLFIEYGIGQLRPQGILSYVLPESLLNVQIHEATRRMLVEETQIAHIDILGHRFSKVFAPSILLTVRKSEATKDNQVSVHNDGENYTISQTRFAENLATIFNVRASNTEDNIIHHMRTLDGVQFLEGYADFALGIVTGNNKHFLLDEKVPGAEPILKGGNVYKYNYDVGKQYIIFAPDQFQQVAPEKWYRAPEKLIYRFINENLVFAYDHHGTLSLNSANMVIPRLAHVPIKYILAILNSRAAQFFHQISFSSVKVLRKHIESIPIPYATSKEMASVLHLVDQMLQTEDATDRLNLYEKIDNLVMRLYQLDQSAVDVIHKKMKSVKFLTR